MKRLLILFMLLANLKAAIPCTVSSECVNEGNEICYLLADPSTYKRYKNNYDSILWQTFFDDVPLGHQSLTEKWHLKESDLYEYTQEGVRIEANQVHHYTDLIQGDALADRIVFDVLEDLGKLLSDPTLSTKSLYDQQVVAIQNQRINQYLIDGLNGIYVYQEVGEVDDKAVSTMAQRAMNSMSGYYMDLFTIALKAELAVEMQASALYVEQVEEGGNVFLKLSEKGERVEGVSGPSFVENTHDWLYVSIVLTILFAFIAWFFNAKA